MNLNNSVTHCIAAESKGIKYQAAKLRGDVIHYSWLFDCCSQKKLLPLKPKYFLHCSEQSKKLLEEEIDNFSDSYYLDLDIVDLKQLLNNVDGLEDSKSVDYYKKKYCPKDKWSYFSGCCIYFHPSTQSNAELKALLELAQKRMKFEVSMGGGKVSGSLSQATHLVIQSLQFVDVGVDAALNSFSAAEVHLLCKKRMHVVGSQWLEDSIENNQRLKEDAYSIKLEGLGEPDVGECENKLKPEEDIYDVEMHDLMHIPAKDEKHKKRKSIAVDSSSLAPDKKYNVKRRGRPAKTSTKSKKIQPMRLRARVGNKRAKICENDSDVDACSEDNSKKDESDIGRDIQDEDELLDKEAVGHEILDHSELSQRGKAVEDKDIEDTEQSKSVDRVGEDKNGIESNEKLEKSETMVDPFEAILLDMIPSLATQTSSVRESIQHLSDANPRPTSSVPESKQQPSDANPVQTNSVPESKQQPSDDNLVPAKKKKFSYKDMAFDLLRD